MSFKDYIAYNNIDVETYFDKIMKECKDFDELPNELVKCNCCKKHKINFPTLECKLPTFKKKIKCDNTVKCDCPCRHIARHTCREWDLINEVEDIDSEEEISEDSSDDGSDDDFIVKDDDTEIKFTKKARLALKQAITEFNSKTNRQNEFKE